MGRECRGDERGGFNGWIVGVLGGERRGKGMLDDVGNFKCGLSVRMLDVKRDVVICPALVCFIC